MGIIELDKKWAVEDARKIARKEGIELGDKSRQLKSARNLLQLGVDIDIIIKATELPRKEIECLQQQ